MGKMEKEVRKRTRRRNIQKIILGTIKTAGLLSVVAVAPNAIQALAQFGLIDTKKSYLETGRMNQTRKKLTESGLISKNKDGLLRLTPKGEAKLRQLELADYKFARPKRWDKKWRVLIFDIPEYRKPLRDKVRRTLITIGFKRLQDSVWIYPYDCEDLITLLKADFKIGRDIIYIIADSIENDVILKKHFGFV